jgi:redox-sensitive bicupin YhaK (pirin superfamily)
MTTTRTIQKQLYATPRDMGGMPIRQPFPAPDVAQIDPFLLLHHADLEVPTDRDLRHSGVGPHPHRGFSPVTFIFKGGVRHQDSRGNDNIVYAGGTQWMNAGMGIVHSERPPHDIHELGGRQELIQLWVNMPAEHKMDQPSYQPLTAEDTPVLISNDEKVRVNIIAGALHGVHGKINTITPVHAFTARFEKEGTYEFSLPANHHAFIYVLHGELRMNGEELIKDKYLALLNNDGEHFSLTGMTNETIVLIASGEPLNEPVVSHGPFVMNNETQLMEAFRDYQMGKMGVLIEN